MYFKHIYISMNKVAHQACLLIYGTLLLVYIIYCTKCTFWSELLHLKVSLQHSEKSLIIWAVVDVLALLDVWAVAILIDVLAYVCWILIQIWISIIFCTSTGEYNQYDFFVYPRVDDVDLILKTYEIERGFFDFLRNKFATLTEAMAAQCLPFYLKHYKLQLLNECEYFGVEKFIHHIQQIYFMSDFYIACHGEQKLLVKIQKLESIQKVGILYMQYVISLIIHRMILLWIKQMYNVKTFTV